MTNTPKKSKKKWIYIGVGITFILIAGGFGFWFWNKSKSSNKSDSDSADEEEDTLEELPEEIKEHRKTDWVDEESGINLYRIPKDRLPKNISVSRAKDELLEFFYQHSNKSKDKKEIARILEKNAQRIDLADKEENKNRDPLFPAKFLERVGQKYQQDIFFNRPDQDQFKAGIYEARANFYYLRISFRLKYQDNKKIDWRASLWEFTDRKNTKTATQEKGDFQKVINYIEREKINPFIVDHVNKFPSLTSLKELNQWANTLALKEAAASALAFSNYFRALRIGKEVLSPMRKGQKSYRYPNIKNEKFALEPVVSIFKSKE